MNANTLKIIKMCHKINKQNGSEIVSYSVDAGFHVMLFCRNGDRGRVVEELGGFDQTVLEKVIQTKIS